MLVFPLGLEAKTRDFPWATVAILAITVAHSIWTFGAVQAYAIARFNDPEMKAATLALAAAAAVDCRRAALAASDCEKMKEVAERDPPANELVLYGRLARHPKLISYLRDWRHWRSPSAETQREPTYLAYRAALEKADQAMAARARAEDVLTANGVTAAALIRSQFLHDGWMHLLGNMAFFLIFAIPLEARVGSAALLAIYLVGGSLGNLAQVTFGSDPNTPLIGASGDVFAVAGAFLAVFWRRSLRVWTSFFFLASQVVRMPTWAFFGGFVLLEQATGAIGGAGNVGYLAHLGAFLPGLAFGRLAIAAKPLPEGFAFPFEATLLAEAREQTDVSRKLATLNELLAHNSGSAEALDYGWLALKDAMASPWAEAPGAARAFARAHGAKLLMASAAHGKAALASVVDEISCRGWPGREIARNADAKLERAAVELAAERPAQAQELISWLLQSIDSGARRSTRRSSLAEALAGLERSAARRAFQRERAGA